VIVSPEFFHLNTGAAVISIFILGTFQAAVQFIFFLDLWREEGSRWNLGIFIATVLTILTVILFSIWIMYHLNSNMMP
jgi:cytochrome o ubiquinol oxidase operon protein cyoD